MCLFVLFSCLFKRCCLPILFDFVVGVMNSKSACLPVAFWISLLFSLECGEGNEHPFSVFAIAICRGSDFCVSSNGDPKSSPKVRGCGKVNACLFAVAKLQLDETGSVINGLSTRFLSNSTETI
eukprot:c18019_g1_i1.p1 GENE.c18019_g1_i1~~c18019_g1_i1.p1  ORF type:complete len:124 (+),score=29.64 c18019_g1_i1:391-762(+)